MTKPNIHSLGALCKGVPGDPDSPVAEKHNKTMATLMNSHSQDMFLQALPDFHNYYFILLKNESDYQKERCSRLHKVL